MKMYKISNKKLKVFYSDLTKKLSIPSKKYNNVLFFNILEHLPEYKLVFSEIYRIIKKGGNFIGSVPFIYQIHAAPNDYFRFSREFLESNLKKYKFKKVKVKSLGFGPFIASYSLLYSYLKYIPLLSQLCLLLAYIFIINFSCRYLRTEKVSRFSGMLYLSELFYQHSGGQGTIKRLLQKKIPLSKTFPFQTLLSESRGT